MLGKKIDARQFIEIAREKYIIDLDAKKYYYSQLGYETKIEKDKDKFVLLVKRF
jgi:hypothetical protein